MNKTFSFKMASPDGEFYNKVKSIKGLRALSGLGLKEAKELSENIAAAFPEAHTTSLSTIVNTTAMEEALYDIKEGGINVVDTGKTLRLELLGNIQTIAADAITKGQYDIAGVLLDLLVSNQ